MIDTARVNARTVALLQNRDDVLASRGFGFAIVREFVTPHIRRRMQKPGVQKFVLLHAECYLGMYSYIIFLSFYDFSYWHTLTF
jgi:hypothetical protein